jgi:hypothetical protein
MKKIFAEIGRTSEFDKDLKKLLKRFKTLEEDLQIFIEKELFLFHKMDVDNRGVFQLTDLEFREPKVFKAKKFACRALKGRGSQSGIRIIYAFFEKEDKIEFIEIYFKGDKENEDRERIDGFFSKLCM